VRALMGRYFAAMKAVIERDGGTVEKFIGDAVMAVFGALGASAGASVAANPIRP